MLLCVFLRFLEIGVEWRKVVDESMARTKTGSQKVILMKMGQGSCFEYFAKWSQGSPGGAFGTDSILMSNNIIRNRLHFQTDFNFSKVRFDLINEQSV